MDGAGRFRIRDWTWEYASFSLQELSRITGLSPTHLRVWRSRGHLPETHRSTDQFTSRDVAEVLVRHRLTFGSIPPSESIGIGRDAAQSVLWHAILDQQVCELRGVKEDVDRSEAQFEKPASVAEYLTGLGNAASYIWRPDREEATLVADIAKVLNDSSFQSHFILDLAQLSAHLAEHAQRALFKIEVSRDTAGQRIRRFV